MPNPWITFVKEWVKENNIPYSQAIKDPSVQEAYNRIKRQSTQQVARNVSQGKLSDIAEKAKALPPKPLPPKPLPKSSAVRAVFASPYVRSKIMAFKPSIEEIERRRQERSSAKKQLGAIAGKQMIDDGATYEEVYGYSKKDVYQYVKFAKVINLIYDTIISDDFISTNNDPNDKIDELEKIVQKLEPLFKRIPSIRLFPNLEIDLEDIGIDLVESWDDEEDDYYEFNDDAEKEVQEWVDAAKELYDDLSPEGKAKKRAEQQKKRDTIQSQLAALAQAQRPKKSRPAPVRRGRKNTVESL